METYQLLTWDSEILKFPVAKILPSRLTMEELEKSLNILRTKDIELVYWISNNKADLDLEMIGYYKSYLVDKRVIYQQTINPLPLYSIYSQVTPYNSSFCSPDLKKLAVLIGEKSRFSKDPFFTRAQMKMIYEAWIENVVKKIAANHLWVIYEKNSIVAFLSQLEKNKGSQITLIAVDPAYQGQGLAKKLIYTAQGYCQNHNYHFSEVVTQKDNLPARQLYESCGYQAIRNENVYHFWLTH